MLFLTGVFFVPIVTFAQHPVALVQNSSPSPAAVLQQQRIPLVDLLKTWEESYSVNFGYADQDVAEKYVTIATDQEKPLKEQLEQILPPLKLRYQKLNEGFFVIHRQENSPRVVPRLPKNAISDEAQTYGALPGPPSVSTVVPKATIDKTITGQVTDLSTDETLPGVNIVVKNTTIGTVTDIDGNYRLTVPDDAQTLVFSSVGYTSEEVAIGSQTVINLAMAPDIQSLEEVVVVGYGTQKKSDLTGSISSISAEDFESQPLIGVDEALQGRSAGVLVNSNSGAPGAGARIRIRGINSIAGDNDPLYVVDGIIGVNFQNVNPNDIASIEILKDASATAIYGSRGANGVVLITTKRAKQSGITVNLNSFYSLSQRLNEVDVTSAPEFARLANQLQARQDLPDAFTAEQISELERTGGTDWQNELFRTGSTQNYQLSIAGKADKTNFYISGNFVDEEGIIINSDFKRYSLLSNINTQLNDWISLDFQIAATRREEHNSGRNVNPTLFALNYDPTQPIYNPDGTFNANPGFGNAGAEAGNPVGLQLARNDWNNTNNARINGGLTINIVEGLSFSTLASITAATAKQNRFYDLRQVQNNPAQAQVLSAEAFTFQNTNTLTYDRQLGKNHRLTLTGAFEQQNFRREQAVALSNDITSPLDGYHGLGVGASQTTTADYSNWGLLSYIGRANYVLADRYLITAAFRADGTSRFYGDNQWGYFPSVSAAWRLSDESFFENLNVFSNLKLRGSWGITGSQAVSPYSALPLLSFDPRWAYAIGGLESTPITGALLDRADARDRLKWEETRQTNVGIDLGFLEGRLSVEFDYYWKQTDDLLLSFNQPDYAGGLGTVLNVGEMENRGFDLLVTAFPIQADRFGWEAALNVSAFKNTIKELGDREEIFTGATAFSSGGNFVVRAGAELGSIVAYKYLGVYSSDEADEAASFNRQPGDAKYLDANLDGAITPDDVVIVGRALPDFIFGFNNTFSYGNFELNLFLQGSVGNDILNTQRLEMRLVPSVPTDPALLDAWEAETNEDSNVTALNGLLLGRSSNYVEDGSFVRLKNVRLAYSLPTNTIPLVQGLQVYVSGQNLLTFTDYRGYDPEASASGAGDDQVFGFDRGVYPNARIYTAGLNLTF